MTPERIADYELVEYLTAGGMADLYLARGPHHDGPVVLKTIQKRYVEMTRVVRMFMDEGRIAKVLDHPNVVRIHDVGEAQGAYYIAMELIVGRDLLAIARRGLEAGRFLPMHLAAGLLAQVATGLTYAHEKVDDAGRPLRIVHCDISPGNVVVSFGGTAKIVDFGIARAAIQLRAEDQTIAGKFNYMAPEQIRGQKLDARADLFSLGIILYELTVGRRLFRGRSEQVKKRILGGDVPRPRDIRPDLPESLERIILRALATDPSERYANARSLRADLLAYVEEDGRPAGKRALAEYLREIFVPADQRSAAQIGKPDPEAGEEFDDDEELALEAPVPGLAELVVDPDDPEPGPEPEAASAGETAGAGASASASAGETASASASASASAGETASASASASETAGASASASASGAVPTHPEASAGEVVLGLLAIAVAVALYFWLR